jgi:hypothetical protein
MCVSAKEAAATMHVMVRHYALRVKDFSVQMGYPYAVTYDDTPVYEVFPFVYPNSRALSEERETGLAKVMSAPPIIRMRE